MRKLRPEDFGISAPTDTHALAIKVFERYDQEKTLSFDAIQEFSNALCAIEPLNDVLAASVSLGALALAFESQGLDNEARALRSIIQSAEPRFRSLAAQLQAAIADDARKSEIDFQSWTQRQGPANRAPVFGAKQDKGLSLQKLMRDRNRVLPR